MFQVLTVSNQAERIVRDGGVSLFGDGSALVRDSFWDEYEISQYRRCECGQRGCEHSLAAFMTNAAMAAYSEAGQAAGQATIYLAVVVLVMMAVCEGLLRGQEATEDIEAAQVAAIAEGVSR